MEYLECKNELELIKLFQDIGIIGKKAPICKKCNVEMKFREKKDNIDKHAWKCPKNSCGTTTSIRNGNFLQQFNKNLHIFLKMVYHWAIRTITTFSFPSSLTVAERHKVHQMADNLNIFHNTTETRYKILTVSTQPIEKKNKTTRQKTAELLKEASKTSFSENDNVNEVLSDKTMPKRPRGRPRKK